MKKAETLRAAAARSPETLKGDRADGARWWHFRGGASHAQRPPSFALAARPGLLLLTVIFLWAFLAILTSWSSRPVSQPDDFSLLAAESSSKLNIASTEVVQHLVSQPRAEQSHPVQEAKVVPVAALGVPSSVAPKAKPPEPAATVAAAPPPPPPGFLEGFDLSPPAKEPGWDKGYASRNSHPGDGPMLRNWKLLGLNFMLVGALTGAPTLAADSDGASPKPDFASQLKEKASVTQFNALSEKVDGLQQSIKNIEKEVARDLAELKGKAITSDVRSAKLEKDMNELNSLLKGIRTDLDALSNRQSAPRIAAYPSTNTGTGRIRLMNSYIDTITVRLNNNTYELAPGEARMVDALPVGKFTYEVFNVQPAVDRTLNPNETFTVNIHPR